MSDTKDNRHVIRRGHIGQYDRSNTGGHLQSVRLAILHLGDSDISIRLVAAAPVSDR